MLLPFLDAMEVTIMEARNFISAREMLTDGNWLLTTMNGEARYEKPPLPTWLTAISASAFGINSVWAMRFPAVLAVMLLGIMVCMLSRKFKLTTKHALINALISVTSLYVGLILFEAPWDVYTHAFMLTAIYFICINLRGERAKISNWLLAGTFIAASVLSKGPVSLYVLFLPFLISYAAIYRKETGGKKWVWLLGTLFLGIALGTSWYLYVRFTDPTTFTAITEKETGNWTSYNVRPFYYYWSFFVQSGLWTIPAFISLLYPYLKKRVSNPKVYKFTILWVLLSIILLSLIPEKKSRYLMPVLIPLALNSGFYIEYLIRRFKDLKDKRETVPVYFNFGLIGFVFLLAGIVILFTTVFVDKTWYSYVFLILTSLTGAFTLYKLYKKEISDVFTGLIVGTVFSVLSLSSIVQNIQAQADYVGFENFNDYPEYPIYGFNNAPPEIVWERGKKLPQLYKDSVTTIPAEDKFYILEFDEGANPSIQESFPGYSSQFLFTLDINTAQIGTRNYKPRKVASVHFLEKK